MGTEGGRPDAVAGYAVTAASTNGWVRLRRDGETGEIRVQLRPGSLRGRTERQVAEEIRSVLVAAVGKYTATHQEHLRQRYGPIPQEILDWAGQQ